MTLKIYGVARSRTIRTLWMAHELGLAYQHIPLATGADGSGRPEYLKLNPNGQIPFIDDDGLILTESLAINLYLARKHGGPLAPRDAGEVGQVAMWTLWAATQLEPDALQALYHSAMLPPAERDAAVVTRALEALKSPLNALELGLAKGGGQLLGGRFTVADLNVASVASYLRATPSALADKPAIRAWSAAAMDRPAARAAFALRGD